MHARGILGRESEQERIDALLRTARDAAGGVLLLRGEPGMGKSSLLEEAARRADDLRVLTARGLETETHLPFAALARLLAPVVDERRKLPDAQRVALESGLALGTPAPADRFAICAATLGLLRGLAEPTPLLVLIDDAHWLDAATADCIGFVARRVDQLRLALLLAARREDAIARGLGDLPELEIGALDDPTSDRFLRARLPELAAPVRRQVAAAAGGNPLALLEIAQSLSPEARRGEAPLPDPLPAFGRIGSIFSRRFESLGEEARRCLLFAAAAGDGDVAPVLAACRAAGLDPLRLEEAEVAGLVRLGDGRFSFVHPLARSSAYHAAAAPSRREAHRGLAAALGRERGAWHLSAAAIGPDEEAASALHAAGKAATARLGHADAAAAFERAADLSPAEDRRKRRLELALQARIVAGEMDRALGLADRFAETAGPQGLLSNPLLQHLRGLLRIATGAFEEGFRDLQELAATVSAGDASPLSAFLLADVAMASLIGGDCRLCGTLADRAAAMLGEGAGDRERGHVLAAVAAGRIFTGDRDGARAAFDEVEPIVAHLDPLDWATGVRTHSLAIHVAVALDEHERARRIAADVLAVLDRAGAIGARANPLGHAADAAFRAGEWNTAWEESGEAILLAEETRADEILVRILPIRARIAAARGLDEEARHMAERAAATAARNGIGVVEPYATATLGFLEVGLGNAEGAIALLRGLGRRLSERHGLVHPTMIPWRPDLCEALVMTGRIEEARTVADELEDEARRTGGAAGRALAARCRGLVEDDYEPRFRAALEIDRQRPMPFERARTLLAFGTRLHRARRRSEARPFLREAEAVFDSLGATPWSERARAALQAAGSSRRSGRAGRDEPTAQEIRVASAIARGLTIRGAATALFLSPKTVDFHLQQLYGKLSIRSRAELALIAAERGWLRAPGAGERPEAD